MRRSRTAVSGILYGAMIMCESPSDDLPHDDDVLALEVPHVLEPWRRLGRRLLQVQLCRLLAPHWHSPWLWPRAPTLLRPPRRLPLQLDELRLMEEDDDVDGLQTEQVLRPPADLDPESRPLSQLQASQGEL